jgi:hypothetical protein
MIFSLKFSNLGFLVLIILFCSFSSNAQSRYTFTNRVNLRLFGGFAAQNGANYDNLFSDGKNGPFGSLFLGYKFDEDNKSANYFGLFGNMAKINGTSILQLKTDDALTVPSTFTGAQSYVYEVEGGFILGEWFRISAGTGNMQIPITNAWQKSNYFTGTSGFIFGRKGFNVHTGTTVMFGGNMKRTAFRVNLGMGLSFKFIKTRKQSS